MREEFEKLKRDAVRAFKDIKESAELENLRVKYFGRKGELAKLMKKVKDLAEEQKPAVGKFANEIKDDLELAYEKVKDELLGSSSLKTKQHSARLDPTLP